MDSEPPYPEYYSSVDKGDSWILQCKFCKSAYSLKKTGRSAGNLLTLLNHASGCEEKAKNETAAKKGN